MQNVPKIVRQRLKAVAPAVNHPDADVLTAFAEQSLPERERAGVLEHLAHCGDCRDIVALALPVPATEAVEAVIRPSRSGWLTWPTLRWGFVAAGVIAIAALGLLQYQRRPATMAANQRSQSVEVAANEPKKSTQLVSTSPTEGKEKLQSPSVPAFDSFDAPSPAVSGGKSGARADAVVARAVPSAGPFHGNASNSLRHGGPSVANQWPQQNMIQNQAAAPPAPSPFAKQQAAGRGMSGGAQVPTVNQTVQVSAEAPAMATESASGEARLAQDQAPAPPSANAHADVTRAKPAALGQIGGLVVDSSGAVVPDAWITVTPTTTGSSATAVTNSQGAWLIAGLPTGRYKAQAEAPGFKTTVLDVNYDANANQPSMYRFTLSPGSVAETVEVSSGQNAQMQTETATVGGPIPTLKGSQVPVSGRNISQLATVSPPRWTISASGALQRSIDQGKSWQTVNVYANALVGANFSAAAAAPRAKVKEADKALKRELATPTFRAVAATGSDVWAGGSGGALYHSADAGNHWLRVLPAAAGASLTGDIISLDFADMQHGTVSTSTPEVWTTGDGGQTWQKQ
jgi:hypothetical protein